MNVNVWSQLNTVEPGTLYTVYPRRYFFHFSILIQAKRFLSNKKDENCRTFVNLYRGTYGLLWSCSFLKLHCLSSHLKYVGAVSDEPGKISWKDIDSSFKGDIVVLNTRENIFSLPQINGVLLNKHYIAKYVFFSIRLLPSIQYFYIQLFLSMLFQNRLNFWLVLFIVVNCRTIC